MLTQVDKFKLTNLKLGTLDKAVVTNIAVHEGQRVLAVEFLGVPDNSLSQDAKCLAALDCYAPAYNAATLFNRGVLQQQLNKHVALCVVKPHIVKNHLLSAVLGDVLRAGFDLASVELFNMHKLEVDEIFEVYKGVLND